MKKSPSKLQSVALDISNHVKSICKRKNNACGVILPSGNHYYVVHGQEVTVSEFNEVFGVVPLRNNVNQYGGNLDGRRIEK